jgi:hypothetical protein
MTMVTELIAILILAVAIAAVAWIWPRLQRRPQRNLRIIRASGGAKTTSSHPSVAPASVSNHEAAKLRRELTERMNSLRQARKPNTPVTQRTTSHDDEGPVIGFAETMIQEDTKA